MIFKLSDKKIPRQRSSLSFYKINRQNETMNFFSKQHDPTK